MADSLQIAGVIQLLGRQASTLPQCPGAVFTLAPGFNLGAPQPQTDVVAQMIVDGSRPVGRRSGNRTVAMDLVITGPSRQIIAAAREILLQLIDQDTWQLTWCRDGGLPMVLDCYRAQATQIPYSLTRDAQRVTLLTVTFEAAPFGRSDEPLQLQFESPAAGTTAPPSPVTLDVYSSSGGWATGWSRSNVHAVGTYSAHWDDDTTSADYPVLTRSFTAADITGLSSLSWWVGLGDSSGWTQNVTFSWVLADASGHHLTVGVTRRCTCSSNESSPYWQLVTAPLPAAGSFDLAHVTGYVFSAWTSSGYSRAGDVYLDTLQAVPTSSAKVPSVRGTVYTLLGIQGSARAPLSLLVQQAPVSIPQSVTYSTPGTGSHNVAPGVTAVKVRVTSGGGYGGRRTTTGSAGGGGGSAVAGDDAYAVTEGQPVGFTVGGGGVSSHPDGYASQWDDSTITAEPGHGVTVDTTTAGAGGLAANSVGAVTYSGGSGAAAGGSNFLTGQNTSFEGGIGNWAAGANCGVAGSSAQAHGGTSSLALTASSAATMNAVSCLAANITTQGMPCSPGDTITASAFFRVIGTGTGRSVNMGVGFYTSAGAFISELRGSNVTDSTSNFTTQATASLTAPATSAYCRAAPQVVSAGNGEVHYIDDVVLAQAATGGGGGESAGSTSGGNSATGTAGGDGGGDGGAGGAGGAAGGNNAGTAGTAPGGGGGGAVSTGSAAAGGNGGNGQVKVEWTQTLSPFRAFIAHRPGADAPALLSPLVDVGDGADTPNGATEYVVPQTTTGLNARFDGTYSVVLAASTINSPSSSRNIKVTITQYEYSAGPSATVTVGGAGGVDITPTGMVSNGLFILGEVTLPVRDIPDSNQSAYYTVKIDDSNEADRFMDALFLDVQGQTAIVGGIPGGTLDSGSGYPTFWLDEPGTDTDLGQCLASTYGRSQAVSVTDSAVLTGGPLTADPGDNALLMYSPTGQPAVTCSYLPRWMADRAQ
jgi:hypothetical protein